MLTTLRRALLVLTIVSVGLVAVGCRDNPPVNYPTVAPIEEDEALLAAGDVIDLVIFYGIHENKATYRLGPSGSVSVQFIGSVVATGKTVGQLQQEIRTQLADGYLVDPIVSVTLIEANSRRVSVFGQVQRAGTIKYTPGMTIVDAVAQSGGFTPMARKNMVQVTRLVNGRKVTYTVPVELIGEGRRPNFPMAAGDYVFVTERTF